MANPIDTRGRGRAVAALVAGAWRPIPPDIQSAPPELDKSVQLLIRSGSASIGWTRLGPKIGGRPLAALKQLYQLYSLNSALQREGIKQVFSVFRSHSIEPILVKGWAIARLYPDPALRPSGDIDLIVHPRDYTKARELLQDLKDMPCGVDLHNGPEKLDYFSFEDLLLRSQTVPLGDVQVRVPCPEDHLRILCTHLLQHGAWRPLWLCDIGAAIESRPPDFDWERCLGPNKRRADWVACTIGLAHQLLDADVDGTPVAERARNLPHWLVPAVLRKWNTCSPPYKRGLLVPSLLDGIKRPREFAQSLRIRWDNPIQATVRLGLPFNNLPRFPVQLIRAILHVPYAVGQVLKLVWR
jgi:hypothetical protein